MKIIDTTRKIHAGQIVRVYKKGFGYCRFTVIENSEYYIAAKCSEEFTKYVKDGDMIEAYIWIEGDSSYEFNAEVIGRINREPWIIFLKHTDEINFSKDRKCLKAKVDIPVNFFIIDTHAKKNFAEDIVLLSGTVLELSDREAILKTDADIPDNVFIRSSSETSKDVEIVGKVLARIAVDKYFVSFEGLGEKERNQILDFVIDRYRE